MKTKLTIALLTAFSTLVTLGLTACGDGEQGTPGEQTAVPEVGGNGSGDTEQDKSAMDIMKEQAEAARQSAAEASDQAKAALAAAGQAAAEQGSTLASSATAKALEMIASVQAYLAENDLDSAQGVMGKLNQVKERLPEALKSEIEALEAKIASMTGGESAG